MEEGKQPGMHREPKNSQTKKYMTKDSYLNTEVVYTSFTQGLHGLNLEESDLGFGGHLLQVGQRHCMVCLILVDR